jgi:GAF domain-containing protein
LDASPITIELAGADPWGAFNAQEADKLQIVQNIRSAFQHLPSGPWPEPPNSAAVIPIRSNVSRQPAGVLIGGISPRQQFDEQYSSFFELLATQVATAIANARQLL